MKNYILLLLLATFGMQAQTLQNPTLGNLKLKNNQTSTTATKVNVQENDGTINTKPLSELANYVEFASAVNLPVTGEQGKLYLTKDNNRLYRFNGTIYQELTTYISGKEDIANKQNSLAVDGTNTKYPTVTAVNTGLALKANLASPALTGAPTAPTATAGTNTTQIATTAFVTSAISTADSGNVKLTGNQTITGTKTFTGGGIFNTGGLIVNSSISVIADGIGAQSIRFSGNANNVGSISAVTLLRKNDKLAIMANDNAGTQRFAILDGSSLSSFDKTFTFPNQTGTFALTNNPTPLTAASFIKSSAPATNILLAGGGDIAQNTAFNKPFGITAGTVVEGGTLGTNAYNSTAYLPLSGGTLTGALTVEDNIHVRGIGNTNILFLQNGVTKWIFGYVPVISAYRFSNGITDVLTLYNDGSSKFSGTVTATSYTATSLPVFENNASASSLAVGQFYRTSTGVLMVKF